MYTCGWLYWCLICLVCQIWTWKTPSMQNIKIPNCFQMGQFSIEIHFKEIYLLHNLIDDYLFSSFLRSHIVVIPYLLLFQAGRFTYKIYITRSCVKNTLLGVALANYGTLYLHWKNHVKILYFSQHFPTFFLKMGK